MRLILTHEQADFDALASLLAAWLLDESALPVLPRRMNRNVRAFVTLYGAELPFIEAQDLPADAIESVTLVDTQSLITLKGLGKDTPIYVIDHHAARPDLPENWQVTLNDVGATVTLLIEALQDGDAPLGMLQATLLLLGIYEDTGSLTYSRTTARDLQAAAFLVARGANLRLAVDFLNHPLSFEQQGLYEAMRAAAQTQVVHGHAVVIACGDARAVDEELSTVAHKLRDHFDPDALFVVLKTRSGVQLIARSSTDHIDVAQIAAYFGGGGHDRAAAALIRERPLEEVCEDLHRQLPGWVRPAITVAQIMSRRPQTLSPETPVRDAALRMQRFGYEGYPVVKDGKVVGLLTRRAVDRAIAHRLHVTTASLMESGEVTIAPNDSLDHLQRLMTDTGWGQIPVVRPDNGEIIGIVTRTDLLKTFARKGAPAPANLAQRLRTTLPPERLALLELVAEVAGRQHTPVYIVGGFVRDLLLERPSFDFDIVVEGDAIALAASLQAEHGGRVTTHGRFGTAKWHLEEAQQTATPGTLSSAPARYSLDLISARTEFYTHPTALPTVERGSIKLDLHRRDFTINTLAMRLDGRHFGELHDYWGGVSDLKRGLVRVLHSVSFVDDPTRMLRAVRFEQRFGFRIEARTLQLLDEALPLLARVTGERIRHELDHLLDEAEVVGMFARLDELGLLEAIHEDLRWDAWFCTQLDALTAQRPAPAWDLEAHWRRYPLKRVLAYALWLVRLPPVRAEAVLRRLMMPREIADAIVSACVLRDEVAGLAGQLPSQIVAHLERFPPLARYVVFLASDSNEAREALLAYATRWSRIHPHITGDDLRTAGLPPGPRYRTLLTRLRSAWLDGEVSSPEEERKLLERLNAEG
ncbi:MAG: CBS domain-containing protein [Chloroflexota bacterium]